MRKDICREGSRTPSGYMLAPGAMVLPEGVIPLSDQNGSIVGFAKDFERDEEGWISADVSVNHQGEYSAYAGNLEIDEEDPRLIVSYRLMEITLLNYKE